MTRDELVPSVEVLIVSYNTRDITAECLCSLRQWAPSDERLDVRVAVCDNGSDDGSAEMVAARFPEVRLVRSSRNLGFGQANNLLAETSAADYLLLLNSDTILVEDLIAPLLAELLADPVRAVVAPRIESPDGSVQWSSQEFPGMRFEFARTLRGSRIDRVLRRAIPLRAEIARIQQEALVNERAPRTTSSLWATCWLMRRADAGDRGPFDPHFPIYDEDLDLCRRLRELRRELVYVPAVRLVHLGGMSSTSSAAKLRLERAARERYYRRYHGRRTAIAFRALKWAASIGPVRRLARITAG